MARTRKPTKKKTAPVSHVHGVQPAPSASKAPARGLRASKEKGEAFSQKKRPGTLRVEKVSRKNERTPKRSNASSTGTTTSNTKKRMMQSSPGNEDELASEDPPPKYQTLVERQRRVPITVIQTKWRTLPQSAQEQVHELLRASKMSVINQEAGKRKTTDVKTILDKVVRRLEDAERKVKFPIRKDTNFNLEKVGEESSGLSNQLTTAQHSVMLLEAEVEDAQKLLESDQNFLAKLARDAKAAQQDQHRQKAKMHPLLRKFANHDPTNDDAESINLIKPRDDQIVFDEVDPDMEPLMKQLKQHLTNLEANSRQVDGVDDAMANARVGLGDISLRQGHLRQLPGILAG